MKISKKAPASLDKASKNIKSTVFECIIIYLKKTEAGGGPFQNNLGTDIRFT